ncbi:MAG: membrane protein insertion efficiency factor YidD [Clostridiales bacterium]|nr:membrane protein insertion efficiency factor YidD [Clostridiales bacterium]
MDEFDITNRDQDESVSVVLTEADFSDEAARAAAVKELFDRATDDEFERPHISAVRAVLNVVIPLVVAAGLFCALFFMLDKHRLTISLSVSLGALFLYFLLRLRAILIWSVRVYQRFAPAEVRRRCVFTPTCSQYAIQALERYGVIRGIPRIISRLRRCHLPNGGEDPLK